MVFRKQDGRIDWVMSGVMTVITAIIMYNFIQNNKTTIETAELKIEVVNMKNSISRIEGDVAFLVREKRQGR